MDTRVVYVAGPYSKGDVARNVRRAIDAGQELLQMGLVPHIPHLYHSWHMIYPALPEQWALLDMIMLAKCDALFRLSGESSGADAEVARALELGIPVFTSYEAIGKWTPG